jgi:2-dehydro-3-deoxyphosphooctonate aldolase (KDO 8-P synthase)
MRGALSKLRESGCTRMMVTERGTFFGYHRLVNDFAGVGDLIELGVPVCFDATHCTQLPGVGVTSGGRPDRAALLARASVAAGVDALAPATIGSVSASATVHVAPPAESCPRAGSCST